jgi:hypothetical protein
MLNTSPVAALSPVDSALSLFWQNFRHGWVYRLWARLTGHRTRLLDYDETVDPAAIESSCYQGVRPVDIHLIRGTQGKSQDFDASFHPLRDSSLSRWLSVARERLRGHSLPPVELLEVNGVYYVRDGHHRISVAHSLGETYIDAEIVRLSLTNTRIM